ncbi:hypothetical protein NliqN6_3417 [Naganishia liquefaciens]|uniref:FHA domain-containing protein n=1 Tax=Naganishia liquefaciens TaxID=104408 RepID=A0A8H3TUM7_9TREE|nr:hypothetical protein NliqN6_3417 [Naganishia liquefaciens]
MTAHTADWQWIPAYHLYFSPSTNTWARPDPATGEWTYLPAAHGSEARGRERGDVVATGYRLPTSKDDEEGGIGNVGWALDVDVGDSGERTSKDGGHDGVEDGEIPDAEPIGGQPPQAPTIEISHGPTPIIHHPPSSTPAPARVLRLVLITSDILPRDPHAPKVAILDSRPGGYYLARDRSAAKPVLRLKEMVVSKVHAMVWYGTRDADGPESQGDPRQGERAFWVVDCGSTHGTFLLSPASTAKPLRLSDPRQSSLPHKLGHLTRLTIGSTTFECHIHADWPCDRCALHDATPIPIDEPGATAPLSSTTSRSATPSSTAGVTMPNAAQWNPTEARRVALTSEAKRMDQARRAGVAMRSLKAQYFGSEAAGGKGKGAGRGRRAE